MPSRPDLVALATRYFRALEQSDRAALEDLLHPSVVQEALPNLLQPQGGKADRAAMLRAFEQGRSAVREQRYEVQDALVEGDRMALQVLWTGVLILERGRLLRLDGPSLRTKHLPEISYELTTTTSRQTAEFPEKRPQKFRNAHELTIITLPPDAPGDLGGCSPPS